MFDRNFDEPNYNPGGGYYGPEQQQGGFTLPSLSGPNIDIKKYLPIAIVIIIVLVIGFFLFSWLTSQQTVKISLKDTDGKSLEGALKLYDKDNKPITLTPKGTASSFTANNLWPGNYTIKSIIVDGYKTTSSTQPFEVPTENGEVKVVMNRDLTATLTATLTTSFLEIYEGQTISGQLNVINTGNSFDATEVAPDGNFLVITLYNPPTTTITQGSSIYIDFNAKVKDGAKLTKTQATNIAFKIKGSTITSNKIPITAMPVVSSSDVALTANVVNTALVAGEEKKYTITIKNNNRSFPLKNIIINIEAEADTVNNLSWLEFSEENDNTPTTTTISSIDPSKSAVVTLYVKPSATSKIGAEFKGLVKVTSFSINAEKTSSINLIVKTEKKISLELKGISSPFSIRCKKSDGTCETKSLSTGEVYFQNTGNVEITNISIAPDYRSPSTSNCQAYLVGLATINTKDTTKIDSIIAGAKENLLLDMTAPEDAPDKDVAKCVVRWSYYVKLDSASAPQLVTADAVIEINKTVS